MYLVAYGGGFAVYGAACVLLIIENIDNGFGTPPVNINRHGVTGISSDGIVIRSRC